MTARKHIWYFTILTHGYVAKSTRVSPTTSCADTNAITSPATTHINSKFNQFHANIVSMYKLAYNAYRYQVFAAKATLTYTDIQASVCGIWRWQTAYSPWHYRSFSATFRCSSLTPQSRRQEVLVHSVEYTLAQKVSLESLWFLILIYVSCHKFDFFYF